MRPDHEHSPAGRDRRQRGSAAVEDDEIGPCGGRELGSGGDVGDEGRAGHPAAAAAAADRRDPLDSRHLEVVRGGMHPRAGEREQLGNARRGRRAVRLGRAAPAHRDHDDLALAGQQPGRCAPSRSSCRRACPCRRCRARAEESRLKRRRVEAEAGADVRNARGEHPCWRSPAARAVRAPARRRDRRRVSGFELRERPGRVSGTSTGTP